MNRYRCLKRLSIATFFVWRFYISVEELRDLFVIIGNVKLKFYFLTLPAQIQNVENIFREEKKAYFSDIMKTILSAISQEFNFLLESTRPADFQSFLLLSRGLFTVTILSQC